AGTPKTVLPYSLCSVGLERHNARKAKLLNRTEIVSSQFFHTRVPTRGTCVGLAHLPKAIRTRRCAGRFVLDVVIVRGRGRAMSAATMLGDQHRAAAVVTRGGGAGDATVRAR